MSRAVLILIRIRESLKLSPQTRLSTVWVRATSGELWDSPLLRETMLSIKKSPSDRLAQMIASLKGFHDDLFLIDLEGVEQELSRLVRNTGSSTPLRSQDDVRNDSLRTTVVAQKVLLSKHKAALSEQDKAYSDLVTRLHKELNDYFRSAFCDPRSFLYSEILVYDLRSPHTEVFQPRPRYAIERALASPHDYLGCDCCGGQDGDTALSPTQPATAILYQLYLESGSLINVSDLSSAFKSIVGTTNEDKEQETL